jgi:hypothetical protein
MNCKNCKHNKTAHKVNYGELTALGGEIEINNCYSEYYDDINDECHCGNWEMPSINVHLPLE